MDEQNRNLILAIVLSTLVFLVWTILFPPVDPATLEQPGDTPAATSLEGGPSADVIGDTPAESGAASPLAADAPRVPIETPRLSGSISLQGGRIDDLSLLGYNVTLEEDSPKVTLFAPQNSAEPYSALFGWVPGGDLGRDDVPNADTIWALAEGETLTPETPITLEWQNGNGLTFQRRVEIDDDYMFTVTQSVQNDSGAAVRLAPHNQIVRIGQPVDQAGFFIIHEGAIRQTGEERVEYNWNNFPDFDRDSRWGATSDAVRVDQNGWIGFTDHYWMTMLIPEADQPFEAVLQYNQINDSYRSIARLATTEIAAGDSTQVTTRLFAGAKEWETIRNYERQDGIYQFLDSIDWGWFFFLTKPIFAALHWINAIIGNMGLAIIGLTLIIKAVLLPLAYKSYVSMAKMKELQPEMEKIKERAGEDRQKLQKEMMELYKKEKVNPAAGCLPILLQIPIFFSLYKVIFVTIELRHAPFFGPFQDLSAPDPTSIMNLFGLLPFAAPNPESIVGLIFIGILPLLLGISMWLQQKLNPAPTDPTQAMIFNWLPWVFMFMLGTFASGLIVYWIANNVITFAQQYLIMRSQGYTPDVFGNIKKSFKREKAAEAANDTKAPSKGAKGKAEKTSGKGKGKGKSGSKS
jgi:YidC/Oxa1 family membrane protein insertase